jgi:hypothetical protein
MEEMEKEQFKKEVAAEVVRQLEEKEREKRNNTYLSHLERTGYGKY